MMMKKILRVITYTLWITCLILVIDYVTSFALKLGKIMNLSFFINLHTYVVGAGQFIIGGGIILAITSFIVFATDNKFMGTILSVRDINEDVDNMKADFKIEFEKSQIRIDARICNLEKSVSELQTNEKLFEQDIEYTQQKQLLAFEAHEGQLLRLIARNTREIAKTAHNAGLNYYFDSLADEAQMLLDKLK